MTPETKPAGVSGGDRKFLVTNWAAYEKGTLRGFTSIVLPSGLILHGIMLHESNGARWIGLPGQRRTTPDGGVTYAPIAEFACSAARERFRRAALDAIDAYLAGEQVAHTAGSKPDEC